jgi:hypothetical protein
MLSASSLMLLKPNSFDLNTWIQKKEATMISANIFLLEIIRHHWQTEKSVCPFGGAGRNLSMPPS